MSGSHYRHTQIGWVILGSFTPVLAVAVWLGLARHIHAIALVAGAVVASLMLLFGWLTVAVDERDIHARFGIGLIRKRIALSEVRAYSRVRNSWVWGWGLRAYPGGWLYNVSGFDAVEVLLRDGRRYRIGTDEPVALVKAIQAVVGDGDELEGSETAAPRVRSKLMYAIPVLVVLAIGGAVFALVGAQAGPPTIAVTTTNVSVKSGFYDVDVPLKDVSEVRLDPSLPRIARRTNGYAGNGSLRGHFDVDGLGNGQLFVEQNAPPYIFVRSSQGFFFVNFKDPARTEELHRQLVDAVENAKRP